MEKYFLPLQFDCLDQSHKSLGTVTVPDWDYTLVSAEVASLLHCAPEYVVLHYWDGK